MRELPFQTVPIQDPYWSPRLELNARRTIFQQWEQLEASRCIDNFRIVTGELESFREGWFFADSDAYKWLDAAARLQALHPSQELASRMDALIELIGRAQQPDGYLFTYNQIFFPAERWVALQVEHELYCLGHLIEAGVSHFDATGRQELLDIARKSADLLVKDFMDKSPKETCGHEEIELALLKLYQVTGEPSYLELARQFLERRGRIPLFPLHLLREFSLHNRRKAQVEQRRQAYLAAHPDHPPFSLPPGNASKHPRWIIQRWYVNALRGFYAQQHAPLRRQTVPVGHSVRFGYLETAAAMLHRLCPDDTLLPAMQAAWERMVERRMYLTGGIGSLPAMEGFGRDYELDPEYAYTETCAALACLFWNWEMALITGEPQYSELFEWQLYNAAAVGLGAGGENYLYNNPLVCRGGITRKPWYAVPCCPSNLSRTWAALGKYIYSYDEQSLWLHQYIGSRTVLDLGGALKVEMQSTLPWQGQVLLHLEPDHPREFTVHLRLPSWSGACTLAVNGEPDTLPELSPTPPPTASGYDPRLSRFIPIHRRWSPGDTVELQLDLPIMLRRAHPRVEGHAGKAGLTRGPLVYCLESVDNPGIDIFTARLNPSSPRSEFEPGLLGGIWVLRGETVDGKPLTAIPYHLWANRGESQMTVWINT